jgi:DNA-binding NarL/FixJ family response regulator
MARTSQSRGDAGGSSGARLDSDVALIAGAESYERIAAVLEEQGLSFELVGSVSKLLEREISGGTVVIRVEENLAGAVTRDIEELHRAAPNASVVVVCDELRPGELRIALAAGAAGVVLEGQLAATLGSCLAATRAGQVCVPKRAARQVEPAALSAREKQILGLVVMGYMNSEIATQLFVAETTVKSHLSSAFSKLGVRSRNEAVDLILDPERGLGMGILGLSGERIEAGSSAR